MDFSGPNAQPKTIQSLSSFFKTARYSPTVRNTCHLITHPQVPADKLSCSEPRLKNPSPSPASQRTFQRQSFTNDKTMHCSWSFSFPHNLRIFCHCLHVNLNLCTMPHLCQLSTVFSYNNNNNSNKNIFVKHHKSAN